MIKVEYKNKSKTKEIRARYIQADRLNYKWTELTSSKKKKRKEQKPRITKDEQNKNPQKTTELTYFQISQREIKLTLEVLLEQRVCISKETK